MRDWYTRYYQATKTSRAYAAFCQRVFGQDWSQHGFADMDQIARLLDEAFARQTLHPDNTPLGQALNQHQLSFRTWNLTQEDYRHAQLKKRVTEELRGTIRLVPPYAERIKR
jgi:hypothetical protein